MIKENEVVLSQKLESIKELVRGNEILKRDLEINKSELKSLKNQVKELEKSEKILKKLVNSNSGKKVI
jgi:hypothetical protein